MLKRIIIVPFEIAVAILLILSGVTSALHFGILDPVTKLLPHWEAVALNIISVLSGILTFLGVAFNTKNVEQSGLIMLMGAILSRFLLFGHYLGYGQDFVQTGLFDLAIFAACIARIQTINQNHVIVRVKEYKE